MPSFRDAAWFVAELVDSDAVGERERLALDWEHADTSVVIEADDGERRFDLTKNLPAKREVLEVMSRHGEDMRGNPEARTEVFEVLRRHGYSVDAA